MISRIFSITAIAGALSIAMTLPSASAAARAKQTLASLTDKEQVAQFLADVSDNHDVNLTVGDFRKVDLDGDGLPELVATVDYSGREFYNTLAVVWEGPEGDRLQTISVWNMKSLDGAIQDLDGDRTQEILVSEPLTPYVGIRPLAVWTSVRSLADKEYSESSSNFRAYYDQAVIPELRRDLMHFRQTGDTHRAEATEVALFKVLQTVGEEPEAGLKRALSWSGESDPLSRLYAVAVLVDIDNAEAREAVRRMAQDDDDEVASFARWMRETRQRGQP